MQQRSHTRVQVAQGAGIEVVERWHSGGAEEKRCSGPDTELLRCRGGAEIKKRKLLWCRLLGRRRTGAEF